MLPAGKREARLRCDRFRLRRPCPHFVRRQSQNLLAQLLFFFRLEAVGIRTRVGTRGIRNGRDKLDRCRLELSAEADGLVRSLSPTVADGRRRGAALFQFFRSRRAPLQDRAIRIGFGLARLRETVRRQPERLPRQAASGPAGPNRRLHGCAAEAAVKQASEPQLERKPQEQSRAGNWAGRRRPEHLRQASVSRWHASRPADLQPARGQAST